LTHPLDRPGDPSIGDLLRPHHIRVDDVTNLPIVTFAHRDGRVTSVRLAPDAARALARALLGGLPEPEPEVRVTLNRGASTRPDAPESASVPLFDASAASEATVTRADDVIAVPVGGSIASIVMACLDGAVTVVALGLSADFPEARTWQPHKRAGGLTHAVRVAASALHEGRVAIAPEAAALRRSLSAWDGTHTHPEAPFACAFAYGVAYLLGQA
jgi:hypothetical protein